VVVDMFVASYLCSWGELCFRGARVFWERKKLSVEVFVGRDDGMVQKKEEEERTRKTRARSN